MAFMVQGTTTVAFADYYDVTEKDQRVFETNEGLTAEIVEDALIQATNRILSDIRSTHWWKELYNNLGDQSEIIDSYNARLVPAPQASLVKDRQQDFTDMTVYFALSEYLYPKVADFGNPDSAEVAKIAFFGERFRELFNKLIEAGDWYDFSGDGTIQKTEKAPSRVNLKRVR